VIKTASFGEAGRGEICHEAKIGIYLLTSETENCWVQGNGMMEQGTQTGLLLSISIALRVMVFMVARNNLKQG
jgi:hypothetical protein